MRFRKSKNQSEPSPPLLREFVYLDELSVYSLYSALQGALPDSIKTSSGHSQESKINGEINAGLGVLGSSISSGISQNISSAREVTSKVGLQALFRALHNETANSRLQLVGSDEGAAPSELSESELTRGTLLEVELELAPANIYRLAAGASFNLDLMAGKNDAFPRASNLGFTRDVAALIVQLLGGEVPLRCKVVGYELHGDGEGLVAEIEHSTLGGADVFLVGHARNESFWKPALGLLGRPPERFKALCRIRRSGLQREWSALQIELVEMFSPDAAAQLRDFESNEVERLVESGGRPMKEVSDLQSSDRELVRQYARLLEIEETADADSLEEAFESSLRLSPVSDVGGRRSAFQTVERSVPQQIDRRTIESARSEIAKLFPLPKSSARRGSAYIECDFVAIYW